MIFTLIAFILFILGFKNMILIGMIFDLVNFVFVIFLKWSINIHLFTGKGK